MSGLGWGKSSSGLKTPLSKGIQFISSGTLHPTTNQDASNKKPTVSTATTSSSNTATSTVPASSSCTVAKPVPTSGKSNPTSKTSQNKNVTKLKPGDRGKAAPFRSGSCPSKTNPNKNVTKLKLGGRGKAAPFRSGSFTPGRGSAAGKPSSFHYDYSTSGRGRAAGKPSPFRSGNFTPGRGRAAGKPSSFRSGNFTPGRGGAAGRPSQSLPSDKSPDDCHAEPILEREEYLEWYKKETNPALMKLRKLALEVLSLKSDRPNAVDKMMSACNRVPVKIEFVAESVSQHSHGGGNSGSSLYRGVVKIEGVEIGSGEGVKLKDAKVDAFEVALQTIFMPFLRVVQLDPVTKQLQSSESKFKTEPPKPSKFPLSKPKVSASLGASKSKDYSSFSGHSKVTNTDSMSNRRHANDFKRLEDFVIVEPKIPVPDCTPTHTLRRSADFNQMLLKLDYLGTGSSVRCTLHLENILLANVSAGSKPTARNMASEQALEILRRLCWVIKTKQACDSDTKLTKEEMFAELNDSPDIIKSDNVGHKMLLKMGWSGGGGMGKDESGISQPVELKSVLNRQGLGLSAAAGVTDEFRRKIHNKIAEYASSNRQDDLVFSNGFRHEERQIIHDECRKLNLRSKSRGKGKDRYLCARRKRNASELFDHIMACGGETFRYSLCPPGSDRDLRPLGTEGESILKALRQRGAGSWDFRNSDGGSWGKPSEKVPQNYGNSRQNFVGGQQNFGGGQQNFGGGQQNFDRGQQNFGKSQQNIWNSQQSFGNSQQGFGNSQHGFENSQHGFENSQHGFENSQQSFGNSQKNVWDSEQNFGNSQQSFGNSQQSFGNSQQSFGNRQQSFRNSQQSFENSQQKFGNSQQNVENSQNFGNNQQNYGNFTQSFMTNQQNYKYDQQNLGSGQHNFGNGQNYFNNPDGFNDQGSYSSQNTLGRNYGKCFDNLNSCGINDQNRRLGFDGPNNQDRGGFGRQNFEGSGDGRFYGQKNESSFNSSGNGSRFGSGEPVNKRGRF